MSSLPRLALWDSQRVVEQMVAAVSAQRAPIEVVVGVDGRFGYATFRMLPTWFQFWWTQIFMRGLPPAAMKMKTE